MNGAVMDDPSERTNAWSRQRTQLINARRAGGTPKA
jgi:hypothetical protein